MQKHNHEVHGAKCSKISAVCASRKWDFFFEGGQTLSYALTAAALVAATATNAALPSGYQLLEYVETDGAAYFDTGVIGKSDTKAETGMMWGAIEGDRGYLGSRTSQNDRCNIIHQFSSQWWFAYRTTSNSSGGWPSSNTYYKVVSEVTSAGKFNLDVNGVHYEKKDCPTGSYSNGKTMGLFMLTGWNQHSPSGTRCYYLKIWQVPEGGTDYVLVRDFMPCKNASGEVGLYDAVNGDFYSKQGSGTLKAGPRSDVPGGYKRIGYLEAYGNSYIDTEVAARSGTKAETGMTWGGIIGQGDKGYLCARNGTDGRFMLIFQEVSASDEPWWWSGYKDKNFANWGDFGQLQSNEYYKVTSEVTDNGVFHMNVNGQTWDRTDGQGTTYDTGLNLHLFAVSGANGAYAFAPSGTRCYYLKIWQDGALVRDFIPCLNSEGVPGLYDAVNNRFYSNKGSGMFRTGPYAALPSGYQRLEYVETDGHSYFNTKVIGRAGIKADAGMMWHGLASAGDDKDFLGARNGDNRFLLMHHFNWQWWLGYSGQRGGQGSVQNDQYYRVVSEVTTNGMFYINVNGAAYSVDWTGVGSHNSNLNLFLLAQGWANDQVYGGCESPDGTRCYYLRIWQGGALVRDFIPCVNDSGVVGLYDAVHAKFYGNDGPGTLRAGPVAFANTYTWHGGASGNLSDVDNWWPPAPMGEFTDEDELVVGSAATITVDAPVAVSRITSNASGATQFSGSANVLTLGSIVNSGSGAASFGCPVQFEGVYPYTTVQGAVALASGARLSNGASAAVVVSGAVTATGMGAAMDGAFTFDGGTLAFADVAPTESDLSARLAFTNASSGFLAGVGAITVDFTARPTRGKVVVCPAGGLTAAAAQAKVTATVNGAPLKGAKATVIGGNLYITLPTGLAVFLR